MKHYGELMKVETASIDLETLAGTFRVISNGVPESNREDIERAMYNIADQLDSISDRLNEAFNELFENIKQEQEYEAKKGKGKTKKESF